MKKRNKERHKQISLIGKEINKKIQNNNDNNKTTT